MTGPVWKAIIPETGAVEVTLEAKRILAVGLDPSGEFACWYIPSGHPGAERWHVRLTGTGHAAPPPPVWTYLGTFTRGALVLHGWARLVS